MKRAAILTVIVFLLTSCDGFLLLLGAPGGSGDPGGTDPGDTTDPTVSPYPLIGDAPVPGDGGALTIDDQNDPDNLIISFVDARDNETPHIELQYAAMGSYYADIATDDDFRIMAEDEEDPATWYTSVDEFTFPRPEEPIYFNVAVKDADGNVAAYEMEYWAPAASTADYTLGSVYDSSSGSAVVVSVPSGSDLFFVLSNLSETTTDMASVDFGSGIQQTRVNDATAPTGTIVPLDTPEADASVRPVGLRGFPGQHTYIEPPTIGTILPRSVGTFAVGDTDSFYVYPSEIVDARLEAVSGDGERSVYVWLDTTDTNAITSGMIDILAETFLQSGDANDIYDWVTAVYGAPWGAHGSSGYIPEDEDDIHILLCDIENDGIPPTDSSRIVGFFDSSDNYRSETSNRRLMFYIDSTLYADYDGAVWDLSDYWPSEVISTLAHEFQHMINFYQRYVLNGGDFASKSEDWENEMASMVAEDLVARNLGIMGPRGVEPEDGSAGGYGVWTGRIPDYLAAQNTRLDIWNEDADVVLDHYGTSYAFGAYLLRAYGAEVFTQLLQQPVAGTAAVEGAVRSVSGDPGITFEELVREWGVAALASNDEDTAIPEVFSLNAGDWIGTTAAGIHYDLGSINFHNYSYSTDGGYTYVPAINVYDPGNVPASMEPYTNLFVRIGQNVDAGSITVDFSTLPNGVTATAVIRE